ncbi:MAG: tetratricopeptide repeat protein [Cyclobacteriaceae bacterium]
MLERELEMNPMDPFNHYAFALEIKAPDPAASMAKLLDMVQRFPDYVPAYYQAAQLLIEAGRQGEAVAILEKGIAEAVKQKNNKAAAEMRSLLDEITF